MKPTTGGKKEIQINICSIATLSRPLRKEEESNSLFPKSRIFIKQHNVWQMFVSQKWPPPSALYHKTRVRICWIWKITPVESKTLNKITSVYKHKALWGR